MTETVETRYPPIISDYYRRLAEAAGAPIARQCYPDPEELESRFEDDGMNENEQSAVPRLIHRYPEHALLLVTSRCAVRCRFCFRKRLWLQPESDITDSELIVVCNYLRTHPQIREILISGGDPLMLSISALEKILDALMAVPSVRVLRIGTRRPVTDPFNVSDELCDLLARYPIRLMTHFNHPAELTCESMQLCWKLHTLGIPLFNQTVLLKGINDDPDTLVRLFNTLSEYNITPHYLFHIDPVAGVSHFATGLKRGHALFAEARKRLSSLSLPTFALDLPHGKGKIILSPDVPLPDPPVFTSPITGEKICYPFS